jgi:hypothetical protein
MSWDHCSCAQCSFPALNVEKRGVNDAIDDGEHLAGVLGVGGAIGVVALGKFAPHGLQVFGRHAIYAPALPQDLRGDKWQEPCNVVTEPGEPSLALQG